jgi:hypothetical protein
MLAFAERLSPFILATCRAACAGYAASRPDSARSDAPTLGSTSRSATQSRGILLRDKFVFGLTIGATPGYGQTGFFPGPFVENGPFNARARLPRLIHPEES